MSEVDKEKEENMAKTPPPVRCTSAAECPPPAIIKEMKEMFLRLRFSQKVAMKLVDD